MRWLAIYVALSRVRNLKSLRSIGLKKDIREIIEAGPPDTLPAQFHKLFDEKEKQTELAADATMAALGSRAKPMHPRQVLWISPGKRSTCLVVETVGTSSLSGGRCVRAQPYPGSIA